MMKPCDTITEYLYFICDFLNKFLNKDDDANIANLNVSFSINNVIISRNRVMVVYNQFEINNIDWFRFIIPI